MHKADERRKYPRLEHHFSVHCSEHDNPVSNDVAQVKNISLGGALFTASRPFKNSREVALRINLLPIRRFVLPLARVIESNERARGHIYDIRVEFSRIEDEDRMVLDTVLSDFFSSQGRYK